MVVTRFSSYYEKFTDGKVVCIDEEIPFEIPNTWEWCRLGCMCDYLHRGKSPKYGTAQVLPIIAQKCNQWDKIYTDRCLFSDLSFIDKYTEEQYLQKGDIIINSTGGGTVGRTGIIEDYLFEKYSKYVADSHVTVVRGNILLTPRFIYYYLISPVIQTGIEERCSGSTNQIELGTSTIYNYLIPVPPYKEQLRITELMQVILQKVEKYGREQEKLENLSKLLPIHLKKSILQEAIQGRLVPQDPNEESASVLLQRIKEEKLRLAKEGKLRKKDVIDSTIFRGDDNRYYEKKGKENIDITEEIPFEIPENWEWCRMQDVMDFINGRAYKKDELLSNGKYKVLRVGNFFTNDSWYYSDLELPDDKYCYHGDLLYAWSASFGPQIWEGEKTIFHYHIWNVKYKQDVLYRDYLYYFLLADKANIKNSTTGSTMIHVSMENMKPRFIPIPPLAEQRRIVETLKILLNKIKGN